MNNNVASMAVMSDFLDHWVELQRDRLVTTPRLTTVLYNFYDESENPRLILAALLATAIQRLST